MKVGINTLYLIPGQVGGTETYLRNLLRALAEIDGENEYVLYANRENADSFGLGPEQFQEIVCPIHAMHRPTRIVFEQTVLPFWAARDGIDVLHSPGYTAPLILRCPGVVTMHDLNYHYFPEDWDAAALWTNRILLPRVAHRSTRILTDSQSSRRSIMAVMRVPDEKIDVIYLGADRNLVETGPEEERSIRAKYNLQGNFIFSVTASHPHKNLDGLVRSYALATRNWDNPPPLVIVGIKGKYQHELEQLVHSQQGHGRIVLTGWIGSKELAALYRAATLFVFLSKYEGFGFPVLEAMTAGVPVISSNATSLPELVADAGVLLDPDDEPAVAQMIQSVVADQTLRNDLINRGFARVARFTWRQTAEATLASYRKAALGPASK